MKNILFLCLFSLMSCKKSNIQNCKIIENYEIDKTKFLETSRRNKNLTSINFNNNMIKLPDEDIASTYFIISSYVKSDFIYLATKTIINEQDFYEMVIISAKENFEILKRYKIPFLKDYEYTLTENVDIILSENEKELLVAKKYSSFSSLQIFDVSENDLKPIYSSNFNMIIKFRENCWTKYHESVVFADNNSNIYNLNYSENNLEQLEIKGEDVIYLEKFNKLIYTNNGRAEIFMFDHLLEKEISVYKITNGLLSHKSIEDFYWFEDQNKLLIYTRKENKVLNNLIWSKDEQILEIDCID